MQAEGQGFEPPQLHRDKAAHTIFEKTGGVVAVTRSRRRWKRITAASGNSPGERQPAAMDLNHATQWAMGTQPVARPASPLFRRWWSQTTASEASWKGPAAGLGGGRDDHVAAPRDAREAKKLQRAHGGCLGIRRRRRTWRTAICDGELYASARAVDFRMGQPSGPTTHCCNQRERGEVKHLSTRRKRNQPRFPQ